MAEQTKKFKTRIINKNEIAADWANAINFIPFKGEIIIYNKDEQNSIPRIKIGDGQTNVNDLPFTDKNLLELLDTKASKNKDGSINVPLTPTDAYHATSKYYVDKTIVEKIHNTLELESPTQGSLVTRKSGNKVIPTPWAIVLGANNIVERAFDEEGNDLNSSLYSIVAGYGNRIGQIGRGGKNALDGLFNIANCSCGFAANRYNTVGNTSAFALGERNLVNHSSSGTLGKGLVTSNNSQVVLGQFNAPNKDAILIVGNGEQNRQNAMTVLKNGTITLGGYLEEDSIVTGLSQKDEFNKYEANVNIGALEDDGSGRPGKRYDVLINTGYTYNDGKEKHNSIRFNDTVGAYWKPETAIQAKLGTMQVKAGETYNLTMRVLTPKDNIDSISFWLATVPTEDYFFSLEHDENDKTNVIYQTTYSKIKKNEFVEIAVKFTSQYSGFLRLGVFGLDYTNFSYYIAKIRLNIVNSQLPKYEYKSLDGNHSEVLYKIAETPCAYSATKSWLYLEKNRHLSTSAFGDIIIAPSMVISDKGSWKDPRSNYAVIYNNSTILMCIVDSIDPSTMKVSEPGIYVHPIVMEMDYEKWIDTPWSKNIDEALQALKTTL